MPFVSRGEASVSYAPVPTDVLWHAWSAVPAQVMWASTDYTARLANWDSHERRIPQLSYPDGNVQPLFDQIHEAVDQQQVHVHVGVTSDEFIDDRFDIAPAEYHRRGDRDSPSPRAPPRGLSRLRPLCF